MNTCRSRFDEDDFRKSSFSGEVTAYAIRKPIDFGPDRFVFW